MVENIAIFVRIRIEGALGPWRFEGFYDNSGKLDLEEIKADVERENGPNTYFEVRLPQ
jgi:hypothetical protein